MVGTVNKRGNSEGYGFLILLALIVSVSAFSVGFAVAGLNVTSSNTSFQQIPKLASIVNNVSTDTIYVKNYLELYNNFSNIKYERIPHKLTAYAKVMAGAKEDNIRGFEIGNKRYAVHFILCNHNTKTCAFRVNGIATGALGAADDAQAKAPFNFTFDENTTLQINTIQLDYCDGRRFCNVYYEAYDIVNLAVITK